jgi:hypothetical protein
MVILKPDLRVLAGGKKLPHIYPYEGKGTRLCLWKPRYKEWDWSMKLSQTYIPWTVEWLWYFEEWLQSGIWAGGGDHPSPRRLSRRPYSNKEPRRCSRIRLSTPSALITSTSSNE